MWPFSGNNAPTPVEDELKTLMIVPPNIDPILQQHGITTKQINSQTIMFIDEESQEAIALRVCTVWDLNTYEVLRHVLQSKQMHKPHHTGPDDCVQWFQKRSIVASFNPALTELTLQFTPIRVTNEYTGHVEDTTEQWVIRNRHLKEYSYGINVWVLTHEFEVITTAIPKTSDTDKELISNKVLS